MTTRYVDLHQTPAGPGDGRPTALQIIQDEALEGKWSDKVILITGCSSGIGVETARALFQTGATLFLTARDLAKAQENLGDIAKSDRVHLLRLDLESLESVRACAAQFRAQSSVLNILICNAGVMVPPEGRTQDGFEKQLGTNHLAHFLLFNLVADALASSATPEFPSRVVMLSSVGHHLGEFNFENYNFDGCYDPMAAYASSKTANLWTANEIDRRFGPRGVHAWSVQPGAVLTNLSQHMSEDQLKGLHSDPALLKVMKYPDQGAATSVWAATSKALEECTGKYLEDCQVIGPWDPSQGPFSTGYAPHAYNQEKAERLWDLSLKLVGLV